MTSHKKVVPIKSAKRQQDKQKTIQRKQQRQAKRTWG